MGWDSGSEGGEVVWVRVEEVTWEKTKELKEEVEIELEKEWVTCLSKSKLKAEKKNKVKKVTGVNFNLFLLHFHMITGILYKLYKTKEY